MLHIVSDEGLEEAALFITARCNNINYTNKLVRKFFFFYCFVLYVENVFVMFLGRKRITYRLQKRSVTSRSTFTRVSSEPESTNITARWCYIEHRRWTSDLVQTFAITYGHN